MASWRHPVERLEQRIGDVLVGLVVERPFGQREQITPGSRRTWTQTRETGPCGVVEGHGAEVAVPWQVHRSVDVGEED